MELGSKGCHKIIRNIDEGSSPRHKVPCRSCLQPLLLSCTGTSVVFGVFFLFEAVVYKEGGTGIHAPAHEWERPISPPLLTNQAVAMLHHLPLSFSHTMLRDAADPLAIGGHHSRTILPSNLLHSCSHLPHDMGISRGIELEALSFVSPSNSLLFSSKAAWKITAQNKAGCQEGWGKRTVPTVMVAAVTLCPAGGGRAARLALFPRELAQPSPRHGPRESFLRWASWHRTHGCHSETWALMAGHGAARRESDLGLQAQGFGSWMERRSFGFGARFPPLFVRRLCVQSQEDRSCRA